MTTRTPSEAFDLISSSRVLVYTIGTDAAVQPRGTIYIRQLDDNRYRWFKRNLNKAIVGSWTWAADETRVQVIERLQSQFLVSQELKSYSELKDGPKQSLRDSENRSENP